MTISRRDLIVSAGAAAISMPRNAIGREAPRIMRTIPSSGETIPAVGLGTWITFNVGDDPVLRDECADVMAAFFEAVGRMIDSSPMYGSSQPVIGYGLERLGKPKALFSAETIWASSAAGPDQIEQSRRLWDLERFDLVQVHNLVAWEAHLETLFTMKADGRLRYVGITTSEGRRHDLFEQIMRQHPLDFVQLSYNIVDREAEERLLPLATERGISVIVNRPFRQGALTRAAAMRYWNQSEQRRFDDEQRLWAPSRLLPSHPHIRGEQTWLTATKNTSERELGERAPARAR